MIKTQFIEKSHKIAKERNAEMGIETDDVIK